MKIQFVNDVNKDFVIKALRSIAELITYNNQHEANFLSVVFEFLLCLCVFALVLFVVSRFFYGEACHGGICTYVKRVLTSNDPEYGHIDINEKQKVLNECSEVENWLR